MVPARTCSRAAPLRGARRPERCSPLLPQAVDGRWYAYAVMQTTAQQIGRAFGAGYGAFNARSRLSFAVRTRFEACRLRPPRLAGAWFLQLEFMQLLFALLTLFAVPSMYFIASVRQGFSVKAARSG